jgi:UDP-N-acetylmuramate: L-alanyl-gamma-D-glutamyl-meso-diaminopimelate ligase
MNRPPVNTPSPPVRAAAPRHYHLIGIAGTAMASLAGLLRAAGHTVTGSDENVYPPMSDQLRELGIRYAEGYGAANLEPRPDWVVVGNAISRGNEELEAVLDRRLPYTSAAATIKEEFLRARMPLAVGGTHGKTTTTSLLAWALESAGLNPSFLIGGVAENFGTSFRLTDSPWFVIEADEYDTAYFDKGPKMWHYLPYAAIVNNAEFDHADIYRDEEAYRFAFARFINLVPRNGTLVAGGTRRWCATWRPRRSRPIESFGYVEGEASAGGEHPRWTARDVEFGPDGTRFTAVHDGEEWGVVETPVTGAINVRNILAVIAVPSSSARPRRRCSKGCAPFAASSGGWRCGRGARRDRGRRLRPPPHGGARDDRGDPPALPRAADRGRLRAALVHGAAARIPGFVPRRLRRGGPGGAGGALPPRALHRKTPRSTPTSWWPPGAPPASPPTSSPTPTRSSAAWFPSSRATRWCW